MRRNRTYICRRNAASFVILLSAIASLAIIFAILTVAPASTADGDAVPVSVSDYDGLKEALKSGADIKLTDDISIIGTLYVVNDSVIDLNGHTLTGNGCTVFI